MILLNKFYRIYCYNFAVFTDSDSFSIGYISFSITGGPPVVRPYLSNIKISTKNYNLTTDPYKISKSIKLFKTIVYYRYLQKVEYIALRKDEDSEIQINVKDKDIEAKRTETKYTRISFK